MKTQSKIFFFILFGISISKAHGFDCNKLTGAKNLVSASTLCNITGKPVSCDHKDEAVCNGVYKKLLGVNWSNTPAFDDIKKFRVNENGKIQFNEENTFLDIEDWDVNRVRSFFENPPKNSVENANKALFQFSNGKIMTVENCPEKLDAIEKSHHFSGEQSSSGSSFKKNVKEVHEDQISNSEKNKKYFKEPLNIVKAKCVYFNMRELHPNQVLLKDVNEREMDLNTLVSRQLRIPGCALTTSKDKSVAISNGRFDEKKDTGISHVFSGIVTFDSDGKSWNETYDYLHEDLNAKARDGAKLSGNLTKERSDDLSKSGLFELEDMNDLMNCNINSKEFDFVMFKKGLCPGPKDVETCKDPENGGIFVGGCQWEKGASTKIKKAIKKITTEITKKCETEVPPVITGKTALDGKNSSESIEAGIPGMTIKNCSHVKNDDGINFPGLYYVERFRNGKRFAQGPATLSFDNNSKKGTLNYHWAYDNSTQQSRRSKPMEGRGDYLTGESVFSVDVDENDNVVKPSKESGGCFTHKYLRATTKEIYESGDIDEKKSGSNEKPIVQTQCFVDGKIEY